MNIPDPQNDLANLTPRLDAFAGAPDLREHQNTGAAFETLRKKLAVPGRNQK